MHSKFDEFQFIQFNSTILFKCFIVLHIALEIHSATKRIKTQTNVAGVNQCTEHINHFE